jgi:formamidopyrimidine-DNA glycosylase
MPELPEVESTVRALKAALEKKTIKQVNVLWPRTIAPYSETNLRKIIIGQRIHSVTRRAKYILLNLNNNYTLAIHLRMSGRLRIESSKLPKDPYDRFTLSLSSGNELRFRDIRKFGRCTLLTPKEIDKMNRHLGPEPLDPKFTNSIFFKLLSSYKRGVKAFLLDQKILSGLGNIYVDEALWTAKISPLRTTDLVTLKESNLLLRSIRRILTRAIKDNGTDFGDGVIYNGRFSPKAYGREGLPCLQCNTALTKLVVAGRGTTICNKCQK